MTGTVGIMEKKSYEPCPIDTSHVTLPESMLELAEQLARNVHEVWAKNRKDLGWTYGETRDDNKKTHPCLVPYEELSEEEKDFDRNTSISTLKFILNAGFSIVEK